MPKHKLTVFTALMLVATEASCVQGLSLDVINDTSHLVSGGLGDSTSTRTLASATYEAGLLDGWLIHVNAQMLRGDNGSVEAGVLQAYSNIDESEFSKLHDVWLQKIFRNGARLKFGQIDANNEFAFANHAGEFIHSSMGFSPSIAFLPTYPAPTLSVNAYVPVNSDEQLALGIYSDSDNEFDEQFVIAEWQAAKQNSRYKLGIWHQTGEIDALKNERPKSGTSGVYAVAEGHFSSSLIASDSAGWFVQLGLSDQDVVEMPAHVGAGVVWYGPGGRAEDSLGIGVSHVSVSDQLLEQRASSETAFELFYRLQMSDWLAVKPDLQYIVSPAGASDMEDVAVVTLRTEVAF